MTVHMVRVLCEPPKGEAEVAVANWVANYREWTGDSVTHALTATEASDGTQYVRGDWRFHDEGEGATAILTDLSERLQAIQGGLWHRLAYHVCTHDAEQPIPDCPPPAEWDTTEYGAVPEAVSL